MFGEPLIPPFPWRKKQKRKKVLVRPREKEIKKNMPLNKQKDPEQSTSLVYSVSELSALIQNQLESGFPPLWLKGEVSNFTAHSSGHWYFTLKDSSSQIRAVMFRSSNQSLQGFQPENGMEVKVQGKISVYKPRGEYQIVCRFIEESGQGALREEFEKLKLKLKQEGLFDQKRPLPFLPQHIVIISSPTGAAIRDILNILKRRCKGAKVTLIPAIVQGEQAEESLLTAVSQARLISSLDVLILTRGGGSLEDLWAFNSEQLSRALFNFPKPVISAVGHEIDFSICDFTADLRAATPSEAAELVVKNAADLTEKINTLSQALCQIITRELSNLKNQLHLLKQSLISPRQKLREHTQYLDDLLSRLQNALLQTLSLKKQNVKNQISLLESLSPLKVLNRGYTLVRKNNICVKTVQDLNSGDRIQIQFHQGQVMARVEQILNK